MLKNAAMLLEMQGFKFFLIEYKVCRILEYKVTNKLWGN